MSTILVIEDDEIMLKAIKSILSKDGHRIIIAKNGIEAFEMVDNETYDAVLTDVMIPFANGLEVVGKVRSDAGKNHIGIIVMSSIANEETIIEAFRLGADDFLKKPILAGELMLRMRKLLIDRKPVSETN
jgi:DNA-binding response OmpR family regulator